MLSTHPMDCQTIRKTQGWWAFFLLYFFFYGEQGGETIRLKSLHCMRSWEYLYLCLRTRFVRIIAGQKKSILPGTKQKQHRVWICKKKRKRNSDICPRFFGDFQISIQASKLSTKKKKGKQNKTLHKTINNRFRINQTTLVKFDL